MIAPTDVLRGARSRARLTQSELARRAGLTQSVVSDYERGRREPSLSTLSRLVAASGLDLAVDLVEPAPRRRAGALRELLARHRDEVLAIVTAQGAGNVRVFGSVARGEDGPSSDVDLLVDLAPRTSLLTLIGLRQDLSDLLGVPVDVVPADSLKPDRAASVLADAVAL